MGATHARGRARGDEEGDDLHGREGVAARRLRLDGVRGSLAALGRNPGDDPARSGCRPGRRWSAWPCSTPTRRPATPYYLAARAEGRRRPRLRAAPARRLALLHRLRPAGPAANGTRRDASQFLYGYEEYRHYYGNCTYDDRVTSDAARFLLRFYATTLEAAYREPTLKALEFVLTSQYPNGAWPQRYPLRTEFAHDGLPDYTSFYTLNDGVLIGNVELMLAAYDDARRRAVLRVGAPRRRLPRSPCRAPTGEAAWAEQYGFDMRPSAARTHEPAGYVIRESRDAIRVLEMFYLLTGDRRYLDAHPGVPRVVRPGEPRGARAQSGRPRATGSRAPTSPSTWSAPRSARAEGYGVHIWTTTPPAGARGEAGRRRGAASARSTRRSRRSRRERGARAYYREHFGDRPPRRAVQATADDVARIIGALDARGAWVTDDARGPSGRRAPGKNPGDTAPDPRHFDRGVRAQPAHADGIRARGRAK